MSRTQQTARKFISPQVYLPPTPTPSEILRRRLSKEHERSRGDDFEDDSINKDRRTWREENSDSDYSITVVVTKQKQGDDEDEYPQEQEEITYNVHKQNLECGPRRSKYFERLFENGSFSESQDNASRVKLHELAAKTFPTFLDYIYSVGDTPNLSGDDLLTEHNATALYFLATYFDVPHLTYHAKKFCLQEMEDADTCGLFYEHAMILQAYDILEPTTRLCKLSLPRMSVKSRFMQIIDVQFWIDVLQDHAENGTFSKWEPYELSRLIVVFCQNNTLSSEEFKTLTRDDYLPERCIHPEAALPLMDFERKIVLEDQDRGGEENQDESRIHILSNLQKRCVNVILQNRNYKDLEYLSIDDGEELEYDSEMMSLKLPKTVKEAILASALQRATTMGHSATTMGHGDGDSDSDSDSD